MDIPKSNRAKNENNTIIRLPTTVTKAENRRIIVYYEIAKKEYLDYLGNEQKASPNTVVTYQSWLNRYERWMVEEGHKRAEIDTALSVPLLRKFIRELNRDNLKGRTVRGALHALRGLGAHLFRENVIDRDCTRDIQMPPKGAAEQHTPSDEEVSEMLNACERQTNERMIAFDRAVLTSLLYTGIRAQECLNLRLGDLDANKETLEVRHGKGDKSRTLFPPRQFWEAYQQWLIEREKMGCSHDYVWAQDSARRISYEWLLKRIDDIAARAGYKENPALKPHAFRHWMATAMLRNGGTINQIQASLGHSQMSTTYLYLHGDSKDAKAMQRVMDFDPRLGKSTKSVTQIETLPSQEHPRSRRQATVPAKTAIAKARRRN